MDTMRELLRSHEQEIVDRVILPLHSQNPNPERPNHHSPASPYSQPLLNPTQDTHRAHHGATLARITELESQLAQLRKESEQQQALVREPPALGTFAPAHPPTLQERESAPAIVESVEVLFPGVERSTLLQIIENRFKPTNIYQLLASEKERAESQRTVSMGGVEFKQAERDGKECKYRMSSFFKAWAVYSGILLKLAPFLLQGDLATALSIYTMNLYDLLEKYAWEGVKAYHFQFHRKRVASRKGIYQANEWRLLDSELIASKCFAHPAPRGPWTQKNKPILAAPRRVHDLPICKNIPGQSCPAAGTTHLPPYNPPHIARTNAGLSSTKPQPCRNWNYRECQTIPCRYQTTVSAKPYPAAINMPVFLVVATTAQHNASPGIEALSQMHTMDPTDPSPLSFLFSHSLPSPSNFLYPYSKHDH